MARGDLLVSLIKLGLSGDKTRLKKVAETIIAEERAKRHTVLANKIDEVLKNTRAEIPPTQSAITSTSTHRIDNLLQEIIPEKRLDDLILSNDLKQICREVVQEHHRADLLRSYSLEPRNRLLLTGPPGNGKTSLAEAIAESLMVPLFVVRYEGVVGTYLGETANRLKKLIDHACTRRCVLFFDEFETLGKERGDTHETGEIKRVVSSLLMQIDSLPSHVVVIGATNHPELLDRAVWRRFQVRLDLPQPTHQRIAEWIERFQQRTDLRLEYAPSTLAKKLHGLNFAEIEEFGTTVLRNHVLDQPSSNIKEIINRTFKTWAARSVKAN
ncbi:AAA family ATPase [Lentisphaera marina]|uniref:AAA family ATPase n=1 Tax=Lentisphaera marina TaxID=1111041 RepID=UPI0023658D9B|nr:AAA family ATPase [Lentisphaera marina]MDD7984371.1 AAA family ATPase [Lentisphaera marina]